MKCYFCGMDNAKKKVAHGGDASCFEPYIQITVHPRCYILRVILPAIGIVVGGLGAFASFRFLPSTVASTAAALSMGFSIVCFIPFGMNAYK